MLLKQQRPQRNIAREKMLTVQQRHHESEVHARWAARRTVSLLTTWLEAGIPRKTVLGFAKDQAWLMGQAKLLEVQTDHKPLMLSLVAAGMEGK